MTEFEKKFKEKAYGEVPSDFNEIKRKIIKENIEPMPAAEPESGKRMPRANIAAAIAAAIAVTLIAAFAVKGGIPRKIGAEQSSADAKDSVGEIAADTDDYFDSLGSEDFSDESAPKEYSVSSLAGSADRQPSSSGKTEGGKTSATSPSAETAGNEGKPSVHDATAAATTSAELAIEPNWDSRSTPGKYRTFVYGGKEYVYPFGYNETASTKRKAEKLGAQTVTGQEPGGEIHSVKAELYALDKFDKKFALGIKFDGDSRIYPYVTTSYVPATLGEFLTAVDYDNSVRYGNVTLMNVTSPVNSQNAADIKKYLFADRSVKNEPSASPSGSYVTLSVSIDELNILNKAMRIYESGYVTTNLVGYQFNFFVGKDNVASFLKKSYNVTFDELRKTGTTLPAGVKTPSDDTAVSLPPQTVSETTKP